MGVRSRVAAQFGGPLSRRPTQFALAVALPGIVAAFAAIVVALVGDYPSMIHVVSVLLAIALICVLSSQLVLTRIVLRRLGAAERQVKNGVTTAIQSSARHMDSLRGKQSRHEYVQESALSRIEDVLAVLRADVEGQVWSTSRASTGVSLQFVPTDERLPRVLFVTSNGAGLGHLTRCLAVAEHSAESFASAILTQSTAHAVVKALGYDVDYFPSQAASDDDWPTWHRRFARHMHVTLSGNAVDAVVFDGAWVYRGVTEACRRLGVPLIWMRRGTWKVDADRTQFDAPLRYCDYVIEPRDGALDGAVLIDGPRWARQCGPISLVDRDSALGSSEAKAALGLQQDQRYVLVQLGAGNINDVSSVRDRVVQLIRAEGNGRIPVVAVPSIAADEVNLNVGVPILRDVYPLGKYLAAFDFGVCAAGYNTVNENLSLQFPAVYVPNQATVTDDQVARARAVEESSLGLCALGEADLDAALRAIMTEGTLERMRTALASRSQENGAKEAGAAIAEIVRG